jgi:Xaa-Pro aminopeptidase
MFRNHREKFLAKLSPDSIAVLRSAPTRTFSNDTEYPYRAQSDFYYLTGYEEPDAIALLRPSAPDGKRYILFVRGRDSRREAFDGARASLEETVTRYGADAAFPVDEFFKSLFAFDPATPGLRSSGKSSTASGPATRAPPLSWTPATSSTSSGWSRTPTRSRS